VIVAARGLRRKNKTWHAYADVNGLRVERSMRTGNINEARLRRDDWVARLRRGQQTLGHPMIVSELIQRYTEHRGKHLASYLVSERSRLARIDRDVGQRRLDCLTAQDVEAIVAAWRGELSIPTANRLLARWKALIRYAADTRIIEQADRAKLTTPKILRESGARLRYLSPAEETTLLTHCGPWLHLAVVLSVETGVRASELLRMAWADVDIASRTVWVGRTKNKRPRGVPLSPRAFEALSTTPRHGDLVLDREDRRQPKWALRREWVAARAAAGLADVHWHDLRHTAASRWAMAAATERDLMDLLGHRSSAMAQRYAHLHPSRLRGLVERASRTTSTEA